MSLWKIQAGIFEQQESAINDCVLAVGWKDVPDLSDVDSRDELSRLYRRLHPEKSIQHVTNVVAQLWAIRASIQVDDWVVVPLKSQQAFAIGKISSGYEYRKDLGDNIRHTRRVRWVSKSMPRGDFDQDLLYSFRAAMSVCQVRRNNAESRVEALMLKRFHRI